MPAGDLTDIVKIGVGAVRQGFGIVPCHPDTADPMCTLTAAAAKKDPDHHCYHVITDDKQARTILTRLTRNDATINLAIDLAQSNMCVLPSTDNPTVMVGDQGYAWCEGEGDSGHALVPPSVLDGVPLKLVGQTNPVEEEAEATVTEDSTDLPLEGCNCGARLDAVEATLEAVKAALKVALAKLQELDNS